MSGDVTDESPQQPTPRRELGRIVDYQTMLDCLRARADELLIAVGGDANEIAGLPGAYLQKILGPAPQKRLGMISLGPVMAVLGLEFVAYENAEAMRRFVSRLKKRDNRFVRSGVTHVELSSRRMRKIGRKGGASRRNRLSPEQRRAAAQNAARARWARTTRKQRSEHARQLVRYRWHPIGRRRRRRPGGKR
jgi:hypothetical protein